MQLKRPDTVKSCLLALAAAASLPTAEAASPLAARASTGGQSAPAAGSAPSAASRGTPASDGLAVPSGVLVHQVASLHGTLTGGVGNARVVIERLDAARGAWVTIASTVTGADGSFTAHWRADHIGKFTIRAVRGGGAGAADANQQSQSSAPTAQLTVYRAATASWFGPGFYGKRTACGETMSPTLLGVAHRSLPCGTLVEITYAGQSITVPVVDRGPYRRGVTWDLTTATAQALGLTENARIGALALRDSIAAPGANSPAASSTGSGVTGPSGSQQAGGTSATTSG